MIELKLPSLGEGIEKGTVIAISVKVGDNVETEQPLMEVETDKVVVEIPADAAGTISNILVNIGDEIEEGTPIIQLAGDVANEAVNVVTETEQEEEETTINEIEEPVQEIVIDTKPIETQLKLPSLGEGIEKGTVIAVHIKEGDTISQEQTLMEVETDKVVVEVPADVSGEVISVLVKAGDEVEAGVPILDIKTNSAEAVKSNPSKKESNKVLEVAESPKEIIKEETKESISKGSSSKGKFRATPLARKIAREIGIDISEVTLPEGKRRIAVKDVKNYAKQLNESRGAGIVAAPKVELPDFSKWGNIHKETMTGIAQATSKNMTTTWSEIPHAWLQEKVDITALEAKRQQHKNSIKEQGGALTITSILVKVMAKALEEFPLFNTSLDSNSNEIIFKDYINIGVAVDSDRGLMVPAIRKANEKSILEISQDLVTLSQKVKTKKISPEELQGATFTISNLGGIGTSAIFPLVNHPQVAILGVAGSQKEAVWIYDKFEPRLIMPLTIGFDHRVINGADAAKFLKYIKSLLEDWFLLNL